MWYRRQFHRTRMSLSFAGAIFYFPIPRSFPAPLPILTNFPHSPEQLKKMAEKYKFYRYCFKVNIIHRKRNQMKQQWIMQRSQHWRKGFPIYQASWIWNAKLSWWVRLAKVQNTGNCCGNCVKNTEICMGAKILRMFSGLLCSFWRQRQLLLWKFAAERKQNRSSNQRCIL